MRKGFRFRRGLSISIAAALAIACFGIYPLLAKTDFTDGKIPPPYFAVPDTGGANNGPGQKDLTQMGWIEDVTTAGGPYIDLFFSWDENTVSGGNTLDGCVLFDNNGNTLIDFAVCGSVNGKPNSMFLKSVTAYTCVDTRNDRCGSPVVKPYVAGDVVGGALKVSPLTNFPASSDELTTNTDPFAAGAGYPYDTTLRLRIKRSFLPAGAKMTNVCSYPSTQPNSDPSDCNVPPGSGFLQITKDAHQTAAPYKTFSFNVISNPSTIGGENNCPAATPCNLTATQVQTATLSLLVGTASIAEAVPNGWSLLKSYCGAESNSNNNPLSVAIESGVIAQCKFENGLDVGTIKLTKIVSDAGTFKISIIGATTTEKVVGSGGSILATNLPTGSYTLQESDGGGLLANYTSVYTCNVLDASGAQISTFSEQGTSTGTLQLARNQTIDCTFTNTRMGGTLTIVKTVNNAAWPAGDSNAKTPSNFTYQVFDKDDNVVQSGNFGNGTVTHTLDPNFSPYKVVEASVAGYDMTNYTGCVNISIVSGGQTTCAITNTAQKAAPTGTTTMKWTINDAFTLAGFRGNPAAGTPTPKVQFRVYTNTTCTGAPLYTETVDIGSNGQAATVTGVLVPAGTYRWIADYAGNAYNNPFATACGSEVTVITGN
jgi:hypothetical protein